MSNSKRSRSKGSKNPNPQAALGSQVKSPLDEILKQDSERKLEISTQSNSQSGNGQSEPTLDDELQDLLSDEANRLIHLSRQSIDLHSVLPKALATPLVNVAAMLNVPPAAFLMVLLSVAGSLLKIGTRLEIDRRTEFYVLPILWTALVAEPGAVKSPIFRLVVGVLSQMQLDERKRHQDSLSKYEAELDAWRAAGRDNGEEKPSKPTPERHYLFQNTTLEAMLAGIADRPESGSVWANDELAGLFCGLNQYKAGGGNDRQTMLSLYQGDPAKINRKSGSIHTPHSAVSVTGTIQPLVLKKLMGGVDDPDGLWARFAWVLLPMAEMPPPGDGPAYDLSGLLKTIYQGLDNIEMQTYRFSRSAFKTWVEWHRWTESHKMAESHSGLSGLYPKARERAGRIALILHCLNAVAGGEMPGVEVADSTLKSAIAITKFCLTQAEILYSDLGAADHPLSPVVTNFVKFVRKNENHIGLVYDWKRVRQWYPGKPAKPNKAQIIDFMKAVEKCGFGNFHEEEKNDGKVTKPAKIEIYSGHGGHGGHNTTQTQAKQGSQSMTIGGHSVVIGGHGGHNTTQAQTKQGSQSITISGHGGHGGHNTTQTQAKQGSQSMTINGLVTTCDHAVTTSLTTENEARNDYVESDTGRSTKLCDHRDHQARYQGNGMTAIAALIPTVGNSSSENHFDDGGE